MNEINEDDPFAMANLRPDDTGLPMTVWVSERAGAPHDVRSQGLYLCTAHACCRQVPPALLCARRRISPLGIYPRPTCGQSAIGFGVNEAVLIDYWQGAISTVELIQRLQRLP